MSDHVFGFAQTCLNLQKVVFLLNETTPRPPQRHFEDDFRKVEGFFEISENPGSGAPVSPFSYYLFFAIIIGKTPTMHIPMPLDHFLAPRTQTHTLKMSPDARKSRFLEAQRGRNSLNFQ